MARREYKGAAVPTRLSANIGSGDTTFGINNAAGWATGGANGPFTVVLDPGTSTEEHILVGSRTATTLNSVTRGVDDTVAVAHSAGADGTVIMGSHATDFNEANRHINDTTIDEHTQYMKTDGTRHDLTARHAGGSVVPTAAPVAIGTALAEGAGTNLARSTHVHTVGTGAINNSNMFAAGVVDAAAIGVDAVGSSELANLSVDTGALQDSSVTLAKMADASVGTVELVDLGVTSAKINHFAGTSYAVTWTSAGTPPSLGNGSLDGEFWRYGRLIYFTVQLVWGSTTSGGTGLWEFSLPATSQYGVGFAMSGLTIMNNSGARFVGINIIGTATDRFRVLERITLNDTSATSPFTWGTSDFLQFSGAFIANS